MRIVDAFVKPASSDLRASGCSHLKPNSAETVMSDSSLTVGVTQCPHGIQVDGLARRLRDLGQNSSEQVAGGVGTGLVVSVSAQQARQTRLGLCPYLSQLSTGSSSPDQWAKLDQLCQDLGKGKSDPVDFLQAAHRAYGPSFEIGDGPATVVFESRPEIVQQILAQTSVISEAGPAITKSSLQKEALGGQFGHQTLFLEEKTEWKGRRELMAPFLNPRHVLTLDSQASILSTVTRHLDSWGQSENPVNLGFEMPKLTLDVAVKHMFSVELSDRELELAVQAFQSAGIEATDDLLGRENPLAQSNPSLDQFAQLILDKRAGIHHDDMLQVLVDKFGSNPAVLKQEIAMMGLLGHETTANLLNWTIAEVSRHPQAMDSLRAEVEDYFAHPDEVAKPSSKLDLGRNTLKETWRLHPPNYLLLREAQKDLHLQADDQKLDVLAGSQILIPLNVVNQNAAGPDGQTWNPERDKGKVFSFGGGQRVCLGQLLARMESAIVLSEIVRRFDIVPATQGSEGTELQPLSQFSSSPSQLSYHFYPRGVARTLES